RNKAVRVTSRQEYRPMDPSAIVKAFPIPETEIEPWATHASCATSVWVRQMNLVRSVMADNHFVAINVGGLSARVYAAAPAHKQSTVTDWLSWLFLFDDQVDEGDAGKRPTRLAPLLDTMLPGYSRTPAAAANPLVTALADIWQRIEPTMP